jgi:crossover junction endodeoxyribonuclease RusA
MVIQLELPYPPSVNHYWGQHGKFKYLGKKGKIFRQEVMERVAEAGLKALEGNLAMHVALYPPDRRKRDVDNVLKPLLDACEHAGCYLNDAQISELHILRRDVIKGGACHIVILTLDSPL